MTETATAADFGMDETGAVVVRKKRGADVVRELETDPEWLARRGAAIRVGHARKRDALGRDAQIIARRSLGESMVTIAADFGISKQRVHQICTRAASSPRSADTAGPIAAADRGGAGLSPEEG